LNWPVDRQRPIPNDGYLPQYRVSLLPIGELARRMESFPPPRAAPDSAQRTSRVSDLTILIARSHPGEGFGLPERKSGSSARHRCLFSELSKVGLISSRPMTVGGTDHADGADGVFSTRAHPDHSADPTSGTTSLGIPVITTTQRADFHTAIDLNWRASKVCVPMPTRGTQSSTWKSTPDTRFTVSITSSTEKPRP
jgi:hypothetical protein